MKWKIAFLIIILSSLPSVALAADPPEPFLFGMTNCSGYDTGDLAVLRGKFDKWYGNEHRNGVDWTGSYHARMNEFARSLGCNAPFSDGGQLTLSYRIAAEWQARTYQWFVAE